MVEGNQRITRAAELHRRLLKLENFDFRPCGRDMALYQHIKEEMGLPDGQFLQALESSGASAADYMRALMKAALPFSGMYSDLLDYCRRSGTRHSKQGVEIEWSMKIDEVDVSVSLEHLRIFEQITSQVQPDVKKWSAAKNEVMEWLSKRALPETAVGKTYPHDWAEVELFSVLLQARERLPAKDDMIVFAGLNRVYFGPEQGRPPAELRSRVQEHSEYASMLSLVRETFGETAIENLATDFIGLPLWQFRWQIYELWVLCTVLQQLEPLGFELQPSRDGNSVLELGRETIVARHPDTESSVVYQADYSNGDGRGVKPDVVVTLSGGVSAEQVGLIVEAKQREALTQGHVDDVVGRYSSAVSAENGTAIIVNYDAIGSCSSHKPEKVVLLGQVVPGSDGKQALLSRIARSAVARSHRKEIWYVDVSCSMASFLTPEFRLKLGRREEFAGSVTLFSFASEVTPANLDDISGVVPLSDLPSSPKWEGHGIDALRCDIDQQRTVSRRAKIFVVTDLTDRGEWAELPEQLGPDVQLLHPETVDLECIAL